MAAQLVSLPEVERLSSRVIRILGGNPGKFTLQGSNTYLVGTGPGRLLVDTGEGIPSWKAAIERVLKDEKATVTEAILTHWHQDHVGGQSQLLELCPSAKIYKKHQSYDDPLADIGDGQVFKVEGASLKAVHSPGHTDDHMALILEEEDAMFTGDNVLGHGTAVFEDLGAYLSSLDKMRGVFRGRAYPGHGAVIEDGPSKILEYIRHRKQREDQVLQVLRSSKSSTAGSEPDEWTSIEIVKIIYKDVPESLHMPAEAGIYKVLLKLQEEEKVIVNLETERWSIKDRATL